MNEETSRQRALLNAPLPARFISMASDGSGGAAAARKAALESKEDGTTVLPGETLLHLCARRGHHCLCSLLLEYGANARIKDSHGYTPLHVSVIFGSSLVTRQLSTEFPRLRRCIQTLSVYVRAWLLRKYRRNTVTSQEISSVPIVVDPDGQVKGSIDGANEERAGDEYMETSKRTPVGYESFTMSLECIIPGPVGPSLCKLILPTRTARQLLETLPFMPTAITNLAYRP